MTSNSNSLFFRWWEKFDITIVPDLVRISNGAVNYALLSYHFDLDCVPKSAYKPHVHCAEQEKDLQNIAGLWFRVN